MKIHFGFEPRTFLNFHFSFLLSFSTYCQSLSLSLLYVNLYLCLYLMSIYISVFILCQSMPLSLLYANLHPYLYFWSVYISVFTFGPSISLSLPLVHLYLCLYLWSIYTSFICIHYWTNPNRNFCLFVFLIFPLSHWHYLAFWMKIMHTYIFFSYDTSSISHSLKLFLPINVSKDLQMNNH